MFFTERDRFFKGKGSRCWGEEDEGLIAKFFYLSLYRQHIWALHGFWRMALDTLARMIRHQVEPKVKLH